MLDVACVLSVCCHTDRLRRSAPSPTGTPQPSPTGVQPAAELRHRRRRHRRQLLSFDSTSSLAAEGKPRAGRGGIFTVKACIARLWLIREAAGRVGVPKQLAVVRVICGASIPLKIPKYIKRLEVNDLPQANLHGLRPERLP